MRSYLVLLFVVAVADPFRFLAPSPSTLPSLLINEIMYAPVSPEVEWIELLNLQATPVDLNNWTLRDNSASGAHVITTEPVQIQPREFVVLTKDPGALQTARGAIPAMVIAVAGFPSLNNTGDAVIVSNAAGTVVDSVAYEPSWGGSNGISLERIDSQTSSSNAGNWSSCIDPAGATPGVMNSIAILDIDLSLEVTDTIVAPPHDSAMLTARVVNRGREKVTDYTVIYFEDSDGNGLPGNQEMVGEVVSPGAIQVGGEVAVSYQWVDPSAGTHCMVARIDCPTDMRSSNNIVSFFLMVGYPRRSIVINEVLYDPLSDEAEYVELMNISGLPVELGGWVISDRPTPRGSVNRNRIPNGVASTMEAGLFVIASDSSIIDQFPDVDMYAIMNSASLGFNNDGDEIVLQDPSGAMVDSIAYSPDWHNPDVLNTKGRSLERISPLGGSNDSRNWSTCTLPIGGTPGGINSLYTKSVPAVAGLSCSPNPFSPDGDGYQDNVVIHVDLPLPASLVNIKIFDTRGRLIRRLVNAEPAGAHGDFIWDGRDDNRSLARIGMYVVFVQAIDDRGGILETTKGVVVLARRLD